jgi:hypothetical protein
LKCKETLEERCVRHFLVHHREPELYERDDVAVNR